MLKKLEIVIANSETGEIYHRHIEQIEMDSSCNPVFRFHNFAEGFYRVLNDPKKYPLAVIQLSLKNDIQTFQSVIPYVY